MKKRLIYIANIRLPTEKAHGLAVMKMCEAFADARLEVELVIPWRMNRIKEDPFDFYGVKRNFRIRKLLCLDLTSFGKAGFLLQWLSFAKMAAIYCIFKKADLYYGRDELTLWFVSFFRKNAVWEPHTAKNSWHIRNFLKSCKTLVPISQGLKDYYLSLGVPGHYILVAPSGVDIEAFENIKETKKELRRKLGLPLDKKIAAYIGKYLTMGEGKGVDELKDSFKLLQEASSQAELIIVTDRSPREVPLFMKAVDALVMNYPDKIHYSKYMSPLKLFEYMASGTPIIAPDLPSLREILDDSSAYFFAPEDIKSLADKMMECLSEDAAASKRAMVARNNVEKYTWSKRAEKILNFVRF